MRYVKKQIVAIRTEKAPIEDHRVILSKLRGLLLTGLYEIQLICGTNCYVEGLVREWKRK